MAPSSQGLEPPGNPGRFIIAMASDSRHGLQAGVFTSDFNKAFHAARRLEVGGVMINDCSMFRVDHMP
jgi:acyl-CoA reductase-like NAD-dependent aldehyde dehydrogenase